jgi:predicted small metal-binding protein
VTRWCAATVGGHVEAEEDELVAAVQEHGRAVHNMEATREQALAVAEPA